MPRFYEEAAHLLFVMMAHGLAIAPSRDHQTVLRYMASILDDVVTARRTHADAADVMLVSLTLWEYACVEQRRRKRLAAIAGTLIGNLITINASRTER